MKHIQSSFKDLNLKEKIFLTIGNFDGIHKGHEVILNKIYKEAKLTSSKTVILSFEPHPKIFFENKKNFLINSKLKKISVLKDLGIDILIDLKFDQNLINLSFEEFEQGILINKLNIQKLFLGNDFRYGNQRKGNIQTLKKLCQQTNIDLIEVDLINDDGNEKVSSSQIRNLISKGEITKANENLVSKFSISGIVIKGDQRGRTIGIPTANIEYPDELVAPPYGVYAVKIKILQEIFNGIVNFGIRPTFNKGFPILEAFIFDFERDIYNEEIEIVFYEKIRNEKKFNGIKELLNQVSLDITVAKKILNYGN